MPEQQLVFTTPPPFQLLPSVFKLWFPSRTHPLTRVDKNVPLEVVAAPESTVAMLTNKVLGDPELEGSVLFNHHYLHQNAYGYLLS